MTSNVVPPSVVFVAVLNGMSSHMLVVNVNGISIPIAIACDLGGIVNGGADILLL